MDGRRFFTVSFQVQWRGDSGSELGVACGKFGCRGGITGTHVLYARWENVPAYGGCTSNTGDAYKIRGRGGEQATRAQNARRIDDDSAVVMEGQGGGRPMRFFLGLSPRSARAQLSDPLAGALSPARGTECRVVPPGRLGRWEPQGPRATGHGRAPLSAHQHPRKVGPTARRAKGGRFALAGDAVLAHGTDDGLTSPGGETPSRARAGHLEGIRSRGANDPPRRCRGELEQCLAGIGLGYRLATLAGRRIRARGDLFIARRSMARGSESWGFGDGSFFVLPPERGRRRLSVSWARRAFVMAREESGIV